MSDLYALRSLQSEFFRLHQSYSRFLDELDFEPSPRVSVQLLRVTDEGWSAVARVRSLQLECAIHDGDVGPPRAYASKEGVAACDR